MSGAADYVINAFVGVRVLAVGVGQIQVEGASVVGQAFGPRFSTPALRNPDIWACARIPWRHSWLRASAQAQGLDVAFAMDNELDVITEPVVFSAYFFAGVLASNGVSHGVEVTSEC